MKRTIIKIDEELCNGCGLCVSGCHEGALQLIDNKARMISDLFCDGLGACIGDCPVGAITLEEREAEPYNELLVMERIAPKGENTIIAHLNHLIEYQQDEFVNQGLSYLKEHDINIDFSRLKNHNKGQTQMENHKSDVHAHTGGGCPGSRAMSFNKPLSGVALVSDQPSELRQWPVQLHLLNPQAPYFKNADVLLAADCVAFSIGNFHQKYLKGKTLAIACPKLDSGKESYIEKLTAMVELSEINTITVMIMEVPCCGGLIQMAQMAVERAKRKVPIKLIMVSLQGEVIKESWV